MSSLEVDDILDIFGSPSNKKEKSNEVSSVSSTSSIKRTMRPNRSKQKGNKYENDIAKALGRWIFNDVDMFSRSITSGAKKTVYTGDIVPQKQMPVWTKHYFHIECKNGYKNSVPSFNNLGLLEKWLVKCLNEVDFAKQPVIWLICRFHGYSSIVISSYMLNNIRWDICLNIHDNDTNNFFYVYKLDDLIERNFYDLVNIEFLNSI